MLLPKNGKPLLNLNQRFVCFAHLSDAYTLLYCRRLLLLRALLGVTLAEEVVVAVDNHLEVEEAAVVVIEIGRALPPLVIRQLPPLLQWLLLQTPHL